MLVFLDEKSRICTPEDIDQLVCAEIPDEANEPKLFEIIKNNMIHGPCGNANKKSPCMEN